MTVIYALYILNENEKNRKYKKGSKYQASIPKA